MNCRGVDPDEPEEPLDVDGNSGSGRRLPPNCIITYIIYLDI